jgi:hypothetical protein
LASFKNRPKAIWRNGRKQSKTLVEPLKQQLETYQKRLQQSESSRNPARSAR